MRSNRRTRAGTLSAMVAAALIGTTIIVPGPSPATAADLDVCPSGCTYSTIPQALAAAGPGDRVRVGAGTYTDAITVPTTASPVSIVGEGPGATILDGNGLRTVLTVPPGADVTVEGLAITRGRAVRDNGTAGTGNGGGIDNEGTLTLSRVLVADNVAEDRGGGIWNSGGTLVVENSVLRSNASGIPGTLFRGGGGGAIASFGPSASVTVRNSELTGNVVVEPTTDFRGGGALNSNFGDVTIEDTLISGNEAGFSSGAVDVRGSGAALTILRSRFTGNTSQIGGALQVRNSAVADIDASTFDANTATNSYGAIRARTARVTITNSTISGNTATRGVGGIGGDTATITLDSVTIVGNSADAIGGLRTDDRVVTADNTVIAGNTDNSGQPDCLGPVESAGPLFVGDPTGCAPTGAPLLTGDALLDPLADAGGSTPTHVPRPGSPLLDTGRSTLTTDQRGLPRPSGAAADLGAVEVQVAVEDTTPPTFTDGTLTSSELTSTSVRLTWSAASDDTAVTGYDVLDGATVVASVAAPDTTVVVSGLTPDTTYEFTVRAGDAAGNVSTDGPSATVTTPPPPPSGHIGPSTATSDPDWADAIPYDLVRQAGALGEVLVVASAGTGPQVRADIAPFTATPLDLDGDLVDDVEVEARPNLAALGPSLDVVVRRLTTPGLTDVEVVAALDLGTAFGTALPATLVNGFRTLDTSGSAGGTLPDSETLRFATDTVTGLDHRITFGFDTVGPSGPMLFVAGIVEGSERVATGAANVLTMQVDEVPATVDTTLTFASTDVASTADPGVVAALEWRSTPATVRPAVTFAYGERERRTKVPAEHDLTLTIDQIAPLQRLRLDLVPDPQPADDQATLTLSGASPTVRVDDVSAEYRRADGVMMRGGFLDVVDDLQLSVDPNGALVLDDGSSPNTRLFFEIEQPGHDFFGGTFSQPISAIFGSLRDRRATTVVDAAVDTSADISIRADGGRGELVVVATSDRADPAIGGLGGVWPATDPLTWSFGRTTAPADPFLRVGVVDDGTTSTVALHANSFSGLELDLDPATLSQLVTVESTRGAELDIDVELAAKTPLGAGIETALRCRATTNSGLVGLLVEPPTTYALDAQERLDDVDCSGDRGEQTASLRASQVPAVTAIRLLDVQDRSGSYLITTPETGFHRTIDDLEIEVSDPRGLLPAGLLGQPVTFLRLDGDGIPSASVDWATGSTSSVDVVSLHPEDPVGRLGAIVATERPVFVEDRPELPDGFDTAAPRLQRFDGWFALWETGTLRLLGGRAVATRSLELDHRPSDGGIGIVTEQAAQRAVVAELFLPRGGYLSPSIGVNGGCELELPDGILTADLLLDQHLQLVAEQPFDASREALRCWLTTEQGALGTATISLRATDLPPQVTLSHDETTASLRTVGGTTGRITANLYDRSDAGLGGVQLLGQPLALVSFLLDEASIADISWSATTDTSEVALDTYGNPAGELGVGATTRSVPPTWGDPAEHGVELELGDADAPSNLQARFVDVRRAAVDLTSRPATELTADIRTEQARPLSLEVTGDGVVAYDVTGRIDVVPAELLLSTNLADRVAVNASTLIESIELHADIGTGAELSDGTRETRRAIHAELTDITSPLSLDLDRIVVGSGGATVSTGGGIGAVDATVASNEAAGLFGSGADRARLLVEDLPGDLEIGITSGGPAGDDGLVVEGATGDPIGRILVELTSDGGQLGTEFKRLFAQLVDVPQTWKVVVAPDADDVSASFRFDDGATGPPTAADAVGRVEVMASRRAFDPGTDDPGAFLQLFADPASAVIERSQFVERLDDGYWPGAIAQTLDELYGVGMPLPTATVPVGIAPDGAGGQQRTVALQDHLVVDDLRDGGPLDLSLGLSDIHSGSLSARDGQSEISLVRPATFSGGGLFIGIAESDYYDYKGRKTGDLADFVPEAPEGAPEIPSAETWLLEWNQPGLVHLGFTAGSIGWSSLPAGSRVTGETSGASARVVGVEGTNAQGSLEFDDWNGVDFADGETLVAEVDGADPRSATADVASTWFSSYRLRGLGRSGADLSTFSIVEAPTRGGAFLDGDTLRYRPDRIDQRGRDAFVFEVCDTDRTVCARSAQGVILAETYDRIRTLQFVGQPSTLDISIAPDIDIGVDQPGIGEITLQAPDDLGNVEFYDGPVGPLETQEPVDYLRLRGNIASQDLSIDVSDLNDFFPGRLAVGSSARIELVGALGAVGAERFVFGIDGEDLSVQTKLDGLLVDDETNDLAEYEGAGECDDFIDLGCWLLFRAGADVRGVGDTTGDAVDGFVAYYEPIEIEPRFGGGVEAVPRFTLRFEDLYAGVGQFEFEIDLLCGLTCDIFPLDVELVLGVVAQQFELGFWDRGFDNVCLPALKAAVDLAGDFQDWDGCIEINTPDYISGTPWTLDLGLTSLLPRPPSTAQPLDLAETSLVPGQDVRIVLPAGTDSYQVMLYSTPRILDTGAANGRSSVTVEVPTDIEPGPHTLVLHAVVDGEIVTYTAEVLVELPDDVDPTVPTTTPTVPPTVPPTMPPNGLPSTGSSPAVLIVIASLLIGLGVILTTRRRRTTVN